MSFDLPPDVSPDDADILCTAAGRPFVRTPDECFAVRDGGTGIVDGVGQAATSAVDAMGRKISEWRTKPRDR